MLNVLIPAAGAGRRFKEAGYGPKPLILIPPDGKCMLQAVFENVAPSDSFSYILIASLELKESVVPWSASSIRGRIERTGYRLVDGLTEGAACSALLAKEWLDNDPLLIANSDQLIDWPTGSIDDFIARCKPYDGGIVLFEADGDSKWSYASFDVELSRVTRVAEKDPISKYATAGIYYWRRGGDFVRSAEAMIAANDRTNGEFYIAPSYNYFIREGADIMPFVIPAESFHGLGTPEDLEKYLASTKERVEQGS